MDDGTDVKGDEPLGEGRWSTGRRWWRWGISDEEEKVKKVRVGRELVDRSKG